MSKEEKLLIKVNGLFSFVLALAGIFLTVFLFKLGGFQSVALYYLVTLITLFFTYILSGYFLKRYSSVSLIRLGFLFFAVLYGLLFILGSRSLDFLLPLGVLNGLAAGNFWVGNNLTQYIATHEHSRHEYFGKLNFSMNLGLSAGPILGGATIWFFKLLNLENVGYGVLFFIVSLLFVFLFFFVRQLPKHTGITFSFLDILKHKRNVFWKIVLGQQFLYGLFDNAFASFSAVLIFLIVKEEFVLGSVNTLSTIVYAAANILAISLLRQYKHAYLMGAIFSSLGLFLFGLLENWLGIASLIFINNIFLPLLNISTSKVIYDVMDKSEQSWQDKYHFLVERDSILGFGRILSYLLLLLFFTQGGQLAVAKTWVLIIPIFPLIIGMLQFYLLKFNLNHSS
ncbi:MAG: MFS transporter [bacterium]|nr:MFS transporter [bacterium]